MKTLALLMILGLATVPFAQGQGRRVGGPGGASPSAGILAPGEGVRSARLYFQKGDFDRAASVCKVWLSRYPNDYNLLFLAAELAFLKGEYAESKRLLEPSKEAQDNYPALTTFAGPTGLAMRTFAAVHCRTEDEDQLWQQFLTEFSSRFASLPVGMVVDEGPQTTRPILVLTILMPEFGSNAPVLLDRLVKLSPNDTFVLELLAHDYTRQQKHAKAVEFLKKAIKASASKDREKKLRGLLIEAEKRASDQKVIGEVMPAPGSSGGDPMV